MVRRARAFSHQISGDRLPKTPLYRLRKLRLWFAWPFVITLFMYGEGTAFGFFLGAPLVVVGEGIRIWSHGYLRKTRRLATDGPYAYVRNPLYVGNFMIGLGFLMMIWHRLLMLAYVAGFSLLYWVTIRGEEERLGFRFNGAYGDYTANVRRFIPRFTPYAGREGARFVMHRVWAHGESVTIMAIIGLALSLFLRQELLQLRRPLSADTIGVSVLTVVLAMALLYDVTSTRLRKRRKKRVKK